MVDDYSSPADTAGFFAGKYQDLYISVPFDPVDMAEINNTILNLFVLLRFAWLGVRAPESLGSPC